jgi:HEAT repeat protein
MTGRGADIFQPCRVALMKVGKPAVQPLLNALAHKNADLEADAKKFEFRPGVLEQKIMLVLGDLRAKEAVPALLAELKKPKVGDNHKGALYALGMIGDPSTTKDVVAFMTDAKQEFTDRKSAADALNFIGDPSSFPALLATARSGDVTKDGQKYPDVRVAAATAYARLGAAAEATAFKPLADSEKAAPEEFKECMTRLELAKKCDKDVACYAAGLDDPSLAKQEKAAFMLGRLGKEGLPPLVKKVSAREPVVRLAVLQSIGKLADKGAPDVLKALDAQIEIDRTKPQPWRDIVAEMRALKAHIESK